jgi:hypothetical protein
VRPNGVLRAFKTPCTRISVRQTSPLVTNRGSNLLLPLPHPLGIRLEGADIPTNAKAGSIYSAAEKVDTSSPTGRLANSISSMDSSITPLLLLGVMMPPASPRSLRRKSPGRVPEGAARRQFDSIQHKDHPFGEIIRTGDARGLLVGHHDRCGKGNLLAR